MTGLLADLLALWQGQVVVFGLVFLRMGGAMALLPAFGERSVPVRIRLILALSLTILVTPAVDTGFPEPATLEELFRIGGTEVVAGLCLGILFRLAIMALQIAGTIAANVTSLAQIFGGSSVDPQPAIAHLFFVGGLALAAMSGLHVKLVSALIESYALFPPGHALAGADLARWGSAQVVHAFALAFTLAAPFLVISVLYNLALGAINRAMPQLMVAFVGAPAITAAGLLLTLLATPFLLGLWLSAFDKTLAGLGAN